jgi:hypothetical protein
MMAPGAGGVPGSGTSSGGLGRRMLPFPRILEQDTEPERAGTQHAALEGPLDGTGAVSDDPDLPLGGGAAAGSWVVRNPSAGAVTHRAMFSGVGAPQHPHPPQVRARAGTVPSRGVSGHVGALPWHADGAGPTTAAGRTPMVNREWADR